MKKIILKFIQKQPYLLFFLLFSLLLSVYSMITVPVHQDDGNIYYEVIYFLNNGFDRGYATLAPVVTIVLYSLLDVYNMPLLLLPLVSTVFFIISLYLLMKLFLGYRYPIFLIFLFPIIFERSWRLSPYPLFLFLFTISFYFFVKATLVRKEALAIQNNQGQESDSIFSVSKSKLYILSALFLSLSVYVYTTSLILLIIPLFFLICLDLPYRDKFKIFFRYYFYVSLFLLPWIYWHFSVGGLKYFYYSPFNWYIVKALPLVNKYFWGYGNIPYLDLLKQYINQLIPNILLTPALVFIIIGLLNYKKFKVPIRFSILWIVFYLLFLPLLSVSAFSRYFFPLVIPFILIASIGLIISKKNYNNKKVLYFVLVLIFIFNIFCIHTSYSGPGITNRLQSDAALLDFQEFKKLINDGKNIFSRHHAFQYFFNNYFIVQSDMAEDDALKLISWSSDSDVKEVLRKYNIGLVILYNNEKRWEHDYYIWIPMLYGETPKHYEKIKNADFFKRVKAGKVYTLYQFVDSEK